MKNHKDGLTATCPHFCERKDYQGGHWIRCRIGTKGFRTTWERNQHYKNICCRCGNGCELLDIITRRGPKK